MPLLADWVRSFGLPTEGPDAGRENAPCAKCAANPGCGRRAVSALFRGEVGEIIDYALRLTADFLLR